MVERLRAKCWRDVDLIALVILLEGFGDVTAVLIPGNLKYFLYTTTILSFGDMNNNMNHLAYQRFNI